MRHPGYRLTDAALFSTLSPTTRIVLGVFLALPERDPGYTALRKLIPARERALAQAITELEAWGCTFDRPDDSERDFTTHRFKRRTRLASVPAAWETRREG